MGIYQVNEDFTYPFEMQTVFSAALIAAAKQKLKVAVADNLTGRMTLRTGFSLLHNSFGEDLVLRFKAVGENQTSLEISVDGTYGSLSNGWFRGKGRNSKVLNDFLNALSAQLQQTNPTKAANPTEKTVTPTEGKRVNMTASKVSQLEKLTKLRDKGDITQDEYEKLVQEVIHNS